MTATRTQIVKQFQQDWTGQLESEASLTACRDVAYRWRERTLDPVTTIQLFFVQILPGNTACTHLRPSHPVSRDRVRLLSGTHEAPAPSVGAAAPLREPRLATPTPQ
jgi:hypothetical protein